MTNKTKWLVWILVVIWLVFSSKWLKFNLIVGGIIFLIKNRGIDESFKIVFGWFVL